MPPIERTYIYFDANWPSGSAGTGSIPEPLGGSTSDWVIIPNNIGNLAKPGYQWLGWAGDSLASSPDFIGTGNEFWPVDQLPNTLYAVWAVTSQTYTITYNGNGSTSGNVPINSNTYANGATVPVAANTGGLAKTGHTFLGWGTQYDINYLAFAVNGSNVTPSSFIMPAYNVVLYAVWQQTYVTVTYDGNDHRSGTAPIDGNSPYVNGSTVTVLGQGALHVTGFYFGGWSTDPEGNVEYGAGSTFTITRDTVLYAIWFYGGPPPGNQFTVNYKTDNQTVGSVPYDLNVYQHGATVTVLGQGTLFKSGYTFLGWSTYSNATSAQYTQGSTFKINANSVLLYAVWGFTGGGLGGGNSGTVDVAFDGRIAGAGSKQGTIKYVGQAHIVKVASNYPNDTSSGAVIENLIIDGNDSNGNFVAGTTGILLENVCNCLIRNITIKNCDVGIEVKSTNVDGAFANRFEHIYMENVKTGIKFTGTSSPAKNFFFTTIDDVCIRLRNDPAAVGIKVESTAKLYCAYIKANVWLGLSNGKGLEIGGQIRFSLVNLGVEEEAITTGQGVQINAGAVVSDNQSFLLRAFLFSSTRWVNPSSYIGEIKPYF